MELDAQCSLEHREATAALGRRRLVAVAWADGELVSPEATAEAEASLVATAEASERPLSGLWAASERPHGVTNCDAV